MHAHTQACLEAYLSSMKFMFCLFFFFLTARDAPYAKARTHLSRDIQMTRPYNNHGHSRTAAENGPSLLS